ncbi:MAG: hypothetical protein JWP30_360, partial [Homoserinimonas sp.]|nr:hypothetical protein [Homoserinimonas sp.]
VATFGPVIYDGWWFFAAILAPVVIAPVVEELFFRGMLQRAVSASKLVAVLASSAIFALIHLASGYSWVATLSTFIVGFAFGSLAARTGRLGGPIIAHATFNGSLVALTLLP